MKKVVAYCRVSSDNDDQLNSLDNQKKYWEDFISNNPDMEFCGIYVDEGLSGTSTAKRAGFNRMIEDVQNKRIDMIYTKEVSRFGRNIIDVIRYTRLLKEKGIGVYFQTDNINTMDNDGELRLSLMATLAQEESRKTSERVKWGQARAMKSGVVFGANRVLGYHIENKTIKIHEEEAKIVKDVYRWYLEGDSLHGVLRKLNEVHGLTKGKMGGKLDHISVRRILQNEKYCGDLKQRKYYTTDYLTHTKKENKGEKEYIIIEDNHEAIIDRDTWNKVQTLINENTMRLKQQKIGYSKSVFGGKIICASCGNKHRRKNLKNIDGTPRPIWICQNNHDKGLKGCSNGSYIREDILKEIFMDTMRKIISEETKVKFLEKMMSELQKRLRNSDDGSKDIETIKKQLAKVQNDKEKLLDLYLSDNSSLTKDAFNLKNSKLQNMEDSLSNALSDIQNRNKIITDKIKRIESIYDIIKKAINLKNTKDMNEFNEELVKNFLDKIEASKDRLKIFLSIGEYDIDLAKYPSRLSNREYSTIKVFLYSYNKWGFGYKEEYEVEVMFGL
jgi:DNA invertase Pin-like site-specific DNA recombinase